MKKVLITGATGFIGGHLAAECVRRGYRVRALVRSVNRAAALGRSGVELVVGDIRNGKAVEEAVAGMNIVFHCAAAVTDWAPKITFKQATVDGTRHICRAAARSGIQRLVYLSTNDVFGRGEQAVIDESFPLRPWKEPYPDHKIRAEEIVWLYHREQRLPVTTIYPCWVYGENDYTLTADLADAIIKRQMLYWRKGAFVFPLYVGNLVDLMLIAAEDDRAVGHGYLAHDGRPVTLAAYCDAVAEALSVPPVSRRLPYPAVYLAAAAMEKTWKLLRRRKRPLLTTYVVRSLGSKARYSIEKAERELGWRPAVSFDEGLARTLAWLKTVDRSRLKTK